MAAAGDDFPSFPSLFSDDQISSGKLECSICLQLFVRPKLLPCSHTLCERCLEKHISKNAEYEQVNGQRQKFFSCPECRESIAVPKNGTAGFKTNFYIAGDIERMRAIDRACDSCRDAGQSVRATHFCQQCSFHMCKHCLRVHTHQFLDHTTVSIANSVVSPTSPNHLVHAANGTVNRTTAFIHNGVTAAGISGDAQCVDNVANMCEQHGREELRFYCQICSTAICRDCRITAHFKHDQVIDIAEAAQLAIYELENHKTESEGRIGYLEMSIESLHVKKQHASKTKTDVETLVKKRAEKLILQTANYRDQVLGRLNEQSQSIHQQFDYDIAKINNELSSLSRKNDAISECLRSGSELDLVRLEFEMRTSSLNDKPSGASEETEQKRVSDSRPSNGFYLDHGNEDEDEDATLAVQRFVGNPVRL